MLRTSPLPSPIRNTWEKWVGTEGKRLIIFTGYIITLSGSHWWWVLKELRVISLGNTVFSWLCCRRPLVVSLGQSPRTVGLPEPGSRRAFGTHTGRERRFGEREPQTPCIQPTPLCLWKDISGEDPHDALKRVLTVLSQTSSLSNTWELARRANSWVPPQNSQKLEGGAQQCVF